MVKKIRFVRNILLISAAWTLVVYVFLTKNKSFSNSKELEDFELNEAIAQLNETLKSLDESKKLNKELETMIRNFVSNTSDMTSQNELLLSMIHEKIEILSRALEHEDLEVEPDLEYEQFRRRVMKNVQELTNYVEYEITRNVRGNVTNELKDRVQKFLGLALEHKRSILNDMDELRQEDGYDTWREAESKRLGDLVQSRLYYLQNPPDCKKARKLICPYRYCGFGCQIHHWVNCLAYAYGTERTMIIQPKEWNYHKGGFEEIFMPLSTTCQTDDSQSKLQWPAPDEVMVVTLNTTYFGGWPNLTRPEFMPSSIPEDLAPRITKLHGHPPSWWVGQFVKYLYRLRPEYQEDLDKKMHEIGFENPIVGIHVRRTDKVVAREGGLHGVDEYMKWVVEYYDQLEMVQKIDVRRVYLSTDEPAVIPEARLKYPDYKIIVNEDGAKVANYSTRYSDESFRGLLLDIHLLSKTDYIICTFSSHICRLSYELMQVKHPDYSLRFHSLETLWHTHEDSPGYLETIIEHKPKYSFEVEALRGDPLELWLWHNFSYGYVSVNNLRTKKQGMIPSFKVIDKWKIAKFPEYNQV